MDTEDRYLNDKFFITLASEHAIEAYGGTVVHNMPDEAVPARDTDHRIGGEQPPVDGRVTFYDPDKIVSSEPYKHFDFPFRDVNRDGLWFAHPDQDKGSKRPVWKWKNFGEPLDNLTLEPSLGVSPSGNTVFHCFIKNGEIEWL